MFYLKYRPRDIKEIDNKEIKRKILNLLESKHIPHAILLTGPKGIGKTSIARIIAKSLNCLKNVFSQQSDSVDPCNQCVNCQAIDNSRSIDVIEIDAASNRGIDEIRQIIKNSSFLPMLARNRIFIIDEVHMITQEGFNAFLKTLEEPPPNVYFILITTNPEKVPTTIRSRTFIINFAKADKNDIISMLKRIAQGEKIKITDDVYELLSQYSDNSFRDAAKLLEELVIQNIFNDINSIKNYLGLRKDNLLSLIEKKDLKATLEWLNNFYQNNGNYKTLIEDILQQLREQLINISLSENNIKYHLTKKQITILMKKLLEAYNLLKISPIESIPLEISIIEYYNEIS